MAIPSPNQYSGFGYVLYGKCSFTVYRTQKRMKVKCIVSPIGAHLRVCIKHTPEGIKTLLLTEAGPGCDLPGALEKKMKSAHFRGKSVSIRPAWWMVLFDLLCLLFCLGVPSVVEKGVRFPNWDREIVFSFLLHILKLYYWVHTHDNYYVFLWIDHFHPYENFLISV